MMNHSLNLTHDGTLIVRVPKGYKVEKVKVETFEGEEIPTHTTPSNTLGALDCVERQAAIEAAIDAADDWDGGCSKERERFIREALEELPSVPRKGKWIDGMCTECEESTQGFLTNFCPNCGSYNGGDSE